MKINFSFVFFLSIFCGIHSQQINEIYEFQKIDSPPQSFSAGSIDGFGYSVSIFDNIALIGNLDNSLNDTVYVYKLIKNTWVLNTKIYSNLGGSFGSSIAIISEKSILIANPEEFINPYGNAVGCAYIYEFNGQNWNIKQKIISGDPSANERFGSSVGFSGNRIIIGCENDNNTGPSSEGKGAAYIFEKMGDLWVQKSKLVANDPQYSIKFGRNVTIFGDQVAIGCPYDNEIEENSGAVYVFNFDGSNWSQTKVKNTSSYNSYFGYDVKINNGKLLIGTYNDGAFLYEFVGGKWIKTFNFSAFVDGSIFHFFGKKVALKDDEVVILGNDIAWYYVFSDNNWNFICNLQPALVSKEDIYFKSVDIGDKEIIIGEKKSVLIFDKSTAIGLKKAYNVYPNPSSENININFFKLIKYKITVRDINGKIILSQVDNYGNINLDISPFKNGIYIVELSGDDVNYFIRFQKM